MSTRKNKPRIRKLIKALKSGEYKHMRLKLGGWDGKQWCFCVSGVVLDLFDPRPWVLYGGTLSPQDGLGYYSLTATALGITDEEVSALICLNDDAADYGPAIGYLEELLVEP